MMFGKPSTRSVAIGAVLIALVGGAYALGRMGTYGAVPAAADAQPTAPGPGKRGDLAPAAGIGAAHLVPLAALDSGSCRTFAPAGWQIVDRNKDGTVLTVASADGRLIASYAGVALSSAHAAGAYGDQFRTPEAVARYMAATLTHESVRMDPASESVGVYRAHRFATATHAGYLLLYRFATPADPGGFGAIARIAIGAADDPRSAGVAGGVAAATRCDSALHPSDGPVYRAPRSDHGTGRAGAGSDADMAGSYNAQLGTGWVHDDAGRNYQVDVTTDWRENGPDGPGYYKQNGNDVTKLTPGLQ